MDRRALLEAGIGVTPLLAGCLTVPIGGSGGERVTIRAVDDEPDIPIRPSIEVVQSRSTRRSPPLLRASVTNAGDVPLEIGEERDIVFAYVHSQERPGLQLLPETSDGYPHVRAGCWRLTEPIAILEYYGILRLTPGESVSRTLGVWGGPDIERGCLPTGEFRFLTSYVVARDATAGLDDPEYSARWGFTLDVTTGT